ncbi:hypothetical protein ACFVTF_29110 [Kitasatospora sp. NPDC057940]|uniref:hypothetical protein n=1 Tax=Kitasatospora sp. NPDC057940 TaxID=3346285 RepID=UPI0036D913E9
MTRDGPHQHGTAGEIEPGRHRGPTWFPGDGARAAYRPGFTDTGLCLFPDTGPRLRPESAAPTGW